VRECAVAVFVSQRRDCDSPYRGQGQTFEIHAYERAERSERPKVEFADVIARDVFHDHAAGVRMRPVGQNRLGADDEVAGAAIGRTARTAPSRGERTAHRRRRGTRRVERHELALFGKTRGKRRKRDPCFDRNRQIARFVVEHARESGKRDGKVVPRGRIADRLQRRAAEDDDTETRVVGTLLQRNECMRIVRSDRDRRRAAAESEFIDALTIDCQIVETQWRRIDHAALGGWVTSPHTAPLGKILSGLKMRVGSNTSRTRPIVARSSVEKTIESVSRFS
jgi:hypothetical protein